MRLSRKLSTTSFTEDRANRLHSGACSSNHVDRLDEGFFEVGRTGRRTNTVRAVMDRDLAGRDDDDLVAECGDFLHDMAGETARICRRRVAVGSDHAVPAWPSHPTVGRFVQDDVLRLVHQRARQRHFGFLTLRESLGPPIGEVVDIELVDDALDAFIDGPPPSYRRVSRSRRCSLSR